MRGEEELLAQTAAVLQRGLGGEALQFRQSLTMTDEDQEFIESVYDELEDEDQVVSDDE